jgi:hypothetical protein
MVSASLPTLPAETEITTQLEAVRRIGEQPGRILYHLLKRPGVRPEARTEYLRDQARKSKFSQGLFGASTRSKENLGKNDRAGQGESVIPIWDHYFKTLIRYRPQLAGLLSLVIGLATPWMFLFRPARQAIANCYLIGATLEHAVAD